MYFSLTAFAILAATAIAIPTTPRTTLLSKRDECGLFWDKFLGVTHTHIMPGARGCQNTRWDGEQPNDDSEYGFSINNSCLECDFYS
jgi:hypothetical protein